MASSNDAHNAARTAPETHAAQAVKDGARSVLVTGGSGFIGSHLVELLLARGDRVVVIDNLSTGLRSNLPVQHAALTVIHGDLAHTLATADLPPVHEVYHLAAAVGVDLVMTHPVESIETNIAQTLAALRFASTAGPGRASAPTLIASSSEVYGKPSTEVFSESDDCVYGPTVKTRWSYACSKALDEHIAISMHRAGVVPTISVRFFNTVGPRQVGRYGMVLPRFVRAALDGQPLRVFGDGTQSRCFCDVRDVAAALPRLLASEPARGGVVNLGHDQPINISTLARTVVETLGSSSDIENVPYDDAYAPGFEDLRHRRPDLTKVRALIGFQPTHDLATTIRDIASWMNIDSDRLSSDQRGSSPIGGVATQTPGGSA